MPRTHDAALLPLSSCCCRSVEAVKPTENTETHSVCVCVCGGGIGGNDNHKVRGGENAGRTLVGSNSPRITPAIPADVDDALKQTSSMTRRLSLKRTGMSVMVANQLAEQARVAQSVNPQRTLRRTNSDFITPGVRCTFSPLFVCFRLSRLVLVESINVSPPCHLVAAAISSGPSVGLTRRPSNSLDDRGRVSRCEDDEQENLIPVGDPDTSGGGMTTSSLLKMTSAPTINVHMGDPAAQEGVEREEDQEEAQPVPKPVRP